MLKKYIAGRRSPAFSNSRILHALLMELKAKVLLDQKRHDAARAIQGVIEMMYFKMNAALIFCTPSIRRRLAITLEAQRD